MPSYYRSQQNDTLERRVTSLETGFKYSGRIALIWQVLPDRDLERRLIEIEIFQREKSCGIHVLKFWLNGYLVYANEICKKSELEELRNSLHNELLWMDRYLSKEGLAE